MKSLARSKRSSLEGAVTLYTEDDDLLGFLKQYQDALAEVFIVSEVELAREEPEGAVGGVDIPELKVQVKRSSHTKCERCWNLRESVGTIKQYPDLCERCAGVVGQ